MSVHSNAFNFSSFVQGSVDPRTGQYALSIDLPTLNANNLCGPDLPLQLNFNPMNNEKTGFGTGWSLKLTRFTVSSGMLNLHSGERFKVDNNGPGEAAVIAERKLESFHFSDISEGEQKRFRIAHKSGLTEILEPRDANYDWAVPVRVLAPSGHGINLHYAPDKTTPHLTSISDDSKRVLLRIDYTGNAEVLIDINPGTEAHARFTLGLQGGHLTSVSLPGPDKAAWQFDYVPYDNDSLYYLTRLESPVGGIETVKYKVDGHAFPGVKDKYLPYATEHILQPDPLDDTTYLKNTYEFSNNNFLGNGAGVSWSDTGLDILYDSSDPTFRYQSTSHHYLGDQVLRTVTRTFNRFHLLTEQVTQQQGCIETVTTKYHEVDNLNFKAQPNHFQLPHQVTKSWTLDGNSNKRRDETLVTLYDTFGNLTEEIQANGIRTVREYYSNGCEGCPEDPEGFVRNLKCETVYPAPVADSSLDAAPIKRNRYRYVKLPALAQATSQQLPNHWLALENEDTFEVKIEARAGGQKAETEHLLHSNHRYYLNMPENPLLHGRTDKHEFSMNGFSASTAWRYEITNDLDGNPTWLQTKETYKAPGGTLETTTRAAQSIISGQLVEDEDLNGVVSRFRYDMLNRLIEHTTAPDSVYQATRSYAYRFFIDEGRKRSYDQVTDAKGVITRVVYDGLNRPIREEREVIVAGDPATRLTRTLSTSRYDSAGRLIRETLYDYPPVDAGAQAPQQPDVTTTYDYGYDGWGARSQVFRSDGVTEFTDSTPFGVGGDLVTEWIETRDQPGVRQNVRVSQLNAFNKPSYEYRQIEEPGQPPVQVGRTDYVYDGFGRCTQDTFSSTTPGSKAVPRIRKFSYDVWGRMYKTVRPNGSALLRSFVGYSVEELITRLEVQKAGSDTAETVFSRSYDGLGRLKQVKIGPRIEDYDYVTQTLLIDKRTAYAQDKNRKRVIQYNYLPQLTEQPTMLDASIEVPGQRHSTTQAIFGYDKTTAQISSADNGNGRHGYEYTQEGYLAKDTWMVGGKEQHHSDYKHSLQGRIRTRKHSDGHECEYGYDAEGRVNSISQGALHSVLKYNSQGLLCSTETRDGGNADRCVLCTQTYDALGREKTRTLTVNGAAEQVLSLEWYDNDLLYSRTLVRDAKEVRKETFEYDELDRLVQYTCTGEDLPSDTKGRQISVQLFRLDDLDRLTRRATEFADGNSERADFTYKEDGSFQLEKVAYRLLEGYTAQQAFDDEWQAFEEEQTFDEEQTFTYDEQGNMLNDELGRKLEYDTLGRLQRVIDVDGKTTLVEYQYDGHDQLLASRHADGRQVHRRFLGHQLDSTLENDVLTQYLYSGIQPLGVQQYPAAPEATRLLHSDIAGSVVSETDAQGTRHANYSVYGERPADNGMRTLLAFNGEAREEALGWYLLGSGYRAYNPGLMRFHSPDSLSQEEAGINPYLYALGNPVNWRDPTGHRVQGIPPDRVPPSYIDPPEKPKAPWGAWIGVAIAGVIFAASVYLMPWSAPLSLSLAPKFALGVAGVTANGIAFFGQIYIAVNNEEDQNLQYILFGLSFAGGFASGVGIKASRAALHAAKAAAARTSGISAALKNIGEMNAGIIKHGGKLSPVANPSSAGGGSLSRASTMATRGSNSPRILTRTNSNRSVVNPSETPPNSPTLPRNNPTSSPPSTYASSENLSQESQVLQNGNGATSPPPIAYPDFTILGVGDELVLKKSNGLGLGYVVKVNSY